jgi:hypothetical protein
MISKWLQRMRGGSGSSAPAESPEPASAPEPPSMPTEPAAAAPAEDASEPAGDDPA